MVIGDAESEKPRLVVADRFECLLDNGALGRGETVLVVDDASERLPQNQLKSGCRPSVEIKWAGRATG